MKHPSKDMWVKPLRGEGEERVFERKMGKEAGDDLDVDVCALLCPAGLGCVCLVRHCTAPLSHAFLPTFCFPLPYVNLVKL
jgi:hypothetical protein